MVQAIPARDFYGPGSVVDETARSVQDDSARIFKMLVQATPGITQDERIWNTVSFNGSQEPITPGPLKAAAVAAALHAMSGMVANELLELRDGPNSDRRVVVDTDHAALWLGSAGITKRNGKTVGDMARTRTLADIFEKNLEKGTFATPLRVRATAAYATMTPGVWYQFHGSLNADSALAVIGLDPSMPCASLDEAYNVIAERICQWEAEALDRAIIEAGICGSICNTPEEWRQTPMSKALSKHPLVNCKGVSQAFSSPPVPLHPASPTDKRPLAGIKVVELVRIIAGPVIGTTLAALGADVIRVNCSRLPDFNSLQITLNAGVRTLDLDLGKEEDLTALKDLIAEADVFVQGYRPGTIAKKGLGLDDLLAVANKRGKGIVYVEENCYGPDGPYHNRPGWQQIADAASGCSVVTGRSLGHTDGTCVLPALPVPDMLTGLIGAIGAMMGIRDRARHGGSYHVFASLMAAAAFLLDPQVGLYHPEVVDRCNKKFQWGRTDPSLFVMELLEVVLESWRSQLGATFAPDSPWITKLAGPWGEFDLLTPVLQLADKETSPRWLTAPEPNCYHERGTISWL